MSLLFSPEISCIIICQNERSRSDPSNSRQRWLIASFEASFSLFSFLWIYPHSCSPLLVTNVHSRSCIGPLIFGDFWILNVVSVSYPKISLPFIYFCLASKSLTVGHYPKRKTSVKSLTSLLPFLEDLVCQFLYPLAIPNSVFVLEFLRDCFKFCHFFCLLAEVFCSTSCLLPCSETW